MKRIRLLKFMDSTLGAWLCHGIAPLCAQRFPLPALKPGSIGRILVVRPGGMGDMVMLLPILNSLRRSFPAAAIDIVCERRNREVLQFAGLPTRILTYDSSPLKTLSALRASRYDLAIDTEQFHHFSAVFCWLSRAPVRVGFNINPARNSLYTHLVNYSVGGFEGDQFMALLHPLGLPPGDAYRLDGFLSSVAPAFPPDRRQPVGKPVGEPPDARTRFIIHPGASAPFKEWSAASFAELAACLHRQRDLAPVIVGDSAARRRAAEIAGILARSGVPATDLTGQLTLPETAALIRGARLFIGADSGLAHLACALGTATVTIFGPSNHVKWGHEDPRHAVVRADLPCAPCSIFGYRKTCRNLECLRRIGPEEVLTACVRVLDQSAV